MINVTPLTIECPLAQGYFPDSMKARKLVDDMYRKIRTEYTHGDLYEFKTITMGYMKCNGYRDHKACEDIVPIYGRIIFGLKDK